MKKLEISREMLRKRREMGARKSEYRLATPCEGRKVVVGEADESDSRTIRLPSSR